MDGIPVQAVEQTMPDPNAVGAGRRPARPGLGGNPSKKTALSLTAQKPR